MNFTHFYTPPPHRHKHIFPFKYLVNFDFFFDFLLTFSLIFQFGSCPTAVSFLPLVTIFQQTYSTINGLIKIICTCDLFNPLTSWSSHGHESLPKACYTVNDVLPCLTLSVVIEICLQWIHSIRLLNSKLWLHLL